MTRRFKEPGAAQPPLPNDWAQPSTVPAHDIPPRTERKAPRHLQGSILPTAKLSVLAGAVLGAASSGRARLDQRRGQSAPARAEPPLLARSERAQGAGTCKSPAASRCQPGQVWKSLGSACILPLPFSALGAELPVGLEGARWTRGTRRSAQIYHKALHERSRSPPRRAAICLCCSPASARCGGAGAEDEEGARSSVALPSQQCGGDRSCGTGCRGGPARTYLPAEPARDASPAAFVMHTRPSSAEPRVGSGPAPRRLPLAGPA